MSKKELIGTMLCIGGCVGGLIGTLIGSAMHENTIYAQIGGLIGGGIDVLGAGVICTLCYALSASSAPEITDESPPCTPPETILTLTIRKELAPDSPTVEYTRTTVAVPSYKLPNHLRK